ncbi:MAG: cell surface protein SprA [Saprospiraceae bacterium]|nr:cell surface protein SprA [Saprospiraceae bacterium]
MYVLVVQSGHKFETGYYMRYLVVFGALCSVILSGTAVAGTPLYLPMLRDTLPSPNYGFWKNGTGQNPYQLKDPAFIEKTIEYDPSSGNYLISEKIGNDFYTSPSQMSFNEYLDYRGKELESEYFGKLSGLSNAASGFGDRKDPFARFDLKNNLLDRLFGGNKIEITPKGQVSLFFGVNYNKTDNPILPVRQRLQGGFDFKMGIQVDVTGKIGEKLNLSTSFNNQATFNFDNRVKLNYNSQEFGEDDIIQKIEAGNVSLPLRSNLIQGSQALFGLKTELKFGYLRLTALASQQQSRRKELTIQGGAQVQDFEVKADQYDENRNFFLSQYNRNNFERALANMPQINSLFQITRVQVWVTNDRNETENIRDIVALADLGEYDQFTNPNGKQLYGATGPRNPDILGQELPANNANDLYELIRGNEMARRLETSVNTLLSSQFGMVQARDFEKVTARLLSPTEYTLDENMAKLGFIQITTNLKPQDVLGISYEFTFNGRHYQVGEFGDDIPYDQEEPNVLFVKMLKSITQRTDIPLWDLMMKNVYNIGAYNVSPEDFRLDIYYEDPGEGLKRFLPSSNLASIPLIRVFNMDNLNVQRDPQPDGIFDFVPGLTIFPNTGRIMFPRLEPFGSTLKDKITDPVLADFYAYQDLYDTILVRAREVLDKNRFVIKGTYKTSVTSRISLGAFNLPRGSLRVTAGGTILRENEDYVVDYNVGQITILNEAYLKAATPIKVSFEDNTLFGFQTRTMLGLRADYEKSENFTIGATFLQLFERPPTFKVNIGDDPINNQVFGLDFSFNKEVPWLTRAVDKIPFIDTKAKSTIQMAAEGAFLKPGHARAINEGSEKDGVVYVDDFEGSTANLPIHIPSTQWVIASVPQDAGTGSIERFPESKVINSTVSGVNRALLNWYQIDPSVRSAEARDDPYQSFVDRLEVFPNQQVQVGTNTELRTLDLRYYPEVRGPYNFDLPNGTPFSDGIQPNGLLRSPEKRWGGIMRDLTTTDWEQANIGYVEMWMLSPYLNGNDGNPGKLVINIGNISEDILRDGRKAFEQGLPTPRNPTSVDNTSWGRIPANRQINTALDPDPEGQRLQDVGLDGLDNEGEAIAFQDVLAQYSGYLQPDVYQAILADPANDDYVAYRDGAFSQAEDVYTRYRGFNGLQGNSAQPPTNDGFTTASRFLPDMEDINRDGTMNESEAYFEYEIPLLDDGQGGLQFNQFIIDSLQGEQGRIWYRVKIPVDQFTKRVNNIPDFRAMRFIRMYVTEFRNPVTLRFAEISMVRNQWRKYERIQPSVNEPNFNTTLFDINAVNIERNSQDRPFGYHLPPGIERENNAGLFPNLLQNEQSLSLDFCNLKQNVGDFIGIYKLLNLDMRVYKRMKMFVHLEEGFLPGLDQIQDQIDDGDLSMFIRFGSDFESNYYEYEIPLVVSKKEGSPMYTDNDYRRYIWPLQNEFDFDLSFFKDLKLDRNGQNVPLQTIYEEELLKMIGGVEYKHFVRVKGNPNIGLVRGVMVGIKNNDTQSHCASIWVNELRLTGLDDRGGYAATARMQAQLADLGRIDMSANYSSIGYGALDQRVQQRARKADLNYDIAGTVELSKFLPDTWGLSIPFYAQYSKTTSTPEFDPYDLDIPLKEKLAIIDNESVRDSVKAAALTQTEIKSYNFTNVRKNRGASDKKPMPWDIENFAFTYAWSETAKQDPIISRDILETHNGGLNYAYGVKVKYFEPFKKVIKNDKYFNLVKNLNFNPIPNNFTFNTLMDRRLGITTYRFAGTDPQQNTFYNKQWWWDRNYALQWDLTKSLKFTFNALNRAVIDELPEFDDAMQPTPDQAKKDEIWQNIRNLGRTKDYNHNISANYTVPTKDIPLMEWVSLRFQYDGLYAFNTASLNVDSLGNVIRNGNTRRVNADLNFETLYAQWNYLNLIQGKKGRSQAGRQPANVPSRQMGAPAKPGDPEEDKKAEEEKKKNAEPSKLEKILVRPLLVMRRARVDYQEQYTNTVPGYTPPSQILGMQDFSSPGWGFVSGFESPTTPWLDNAGANNWITQNVWLNQNVERTYQQTLRGTLTLEPVNQFRVDVDFTRTYNESYFELYKVREPGDGLSHNPIQNVGTYSISFMSFKTLFRNDDGARTLFENFQTNREIISQRMGLGQHAVDGSGYTEGFGKRQLSVLIPAFIATYTGQNPNSSPLFEDLFNYVPRPNWKLSYDGLAKLPGMEDIFSSFRITHGYKSTLSVNSFQADFLDYDSSNPTRLNPETQNFYSEFIIPDVIITEAFAPLVGIDFRTKNGLNMTINYNTSRNLQLLLNDPQLPETKATDISFNFGYIIKKVKLPFLYIGVNKKERKNMPGQDLTIQLNTSFRDDIQLNHQIDTEETISIPARGNRSIRINPTIDYPLNDRIRLQLRYEYTQNKPKTFNGFKTTTNVGGINVIFTLN